MPKMHQNTFGCRASPNPLGSLSALQTPYSQLGVLLLRGGTFQLTGLNTK